MLACKEKKHQNYYYCFHLDRLALRILKSHQKLQTGEDLESSEGFYITWCIYPWVERRRRHLSFSPSPICSNASSKLFPPVPYCLLSSFSQGCGGVGKYGSISVFWYEFISYTVVYQGPRTFNAGFHICGLADFPNSLFCF